MVVIHNALVGIGYGLLVLFFAMGLFQSVASFRDFQRPEFALRHLIRFILSKTAVGHCMEIMVAVFNICGGITETVMGSIGGAVSTTATLPTEIVEAIEEESGAEASAKELIHLVEEVRHHDIRAIFVEENGSGSAASIIAAETGVSLFSLSMAMSGDDYFEAMYANIDALKEALK